PMLVSLLMTPRPPRRPTLFPYTTLFRSCSRRRAANPCRGRCLHRPAGQETLCGRSTNIIPYREVSQHAEAPRQIWRGASHFLCCVLYQPPIKKSSTSQPSPPVSRYSSV